MCAGVGRRIRFRTCAGVGSGGRFRKVPEGSGAGRKVLEGSGMCWCRFRRQGVYSSGRFGKVPCAGVGSRGKFRNVLEFRRAGVAQLEEDVELEQKLQEPEYQPLVQKEPKDQKPATRKPTSKSQRGKF